MTRIEMMKVLYAFLLENGRPTTGEKSFYGGWSENGLSSKLKKVLGVFTSIYSDGLLKFRNKVKFELKKKLSGKNEADWEKMPIPDYWEATEFAGTFANNHDTVECLSVRIILDEEEFHISYSDRSLPSEIKAILEALKTKKERIDLIQRAKDFWK